MPLGRLLAGILTLALSWTLVRPAGAVGGVTFQIHALRRVSLDVGAEWRVGVGVTVPLDRIAGGSGSFAQSSGEAIPPIDEQGSEAATRADAESPPPRVVRDEPHAARRSRARRAAPRLDPVLARETVRSVLRAQGDPVALRRLESLRSRANTSAWLPELRLAGGRATDQSLRLNATADDPNRYVQSGGSDLWGEVRLTWKLDRLVFSSDELAVERIAEHRSGARMKLVAAVFARLFAWHRARVRAKDPTLLPEERDEALLDRLEAEVWLDVMSDGWFSERAARGERQVPPNVAP